MITLYTSGHEEHQILAEVWRLFFGRAVLCETGDGVLVHEQDASPAVSIESALAGNRISTTVRASGAESFSLSEPCAYKDRRRVLKRQLYHALEQVTGIRFPWGSLTGVRPTQMADSILSAAGSPETAIHAMVQDWRVSPAKARLAMETNDAEQAILKRLPAAAYAVYVGIPFCPSRCLYCSFTSRDAGRDPSLLLRYTDAVAEELAACYSGPDYGTPVAVYIGGGTPTTLADDAFDRLLGRLSGMVGGQPEVTVEAGRPETITNEKLRILQSHGISRICINPQTMNRETLPKLNRLHDTDDVIRVFHQARQHGMTDINMDLIAGLTDETPADFLFSVDALIRLNPEKITLHALARKAGSFLNEQDGKGSICRPLPAWIDAFQTAQDRLRAAGYFPYYLYRQKYAHAGLENIGFARPGHETVYNVAMMSDRVHVLGFGAGASTKFIVNARANRLHNPKDVRLYLEQAGQLGQSKVSAASKFL